MIGLNSVKRTLLLGDGSLIGELLTEIDRRAHCRYRVVGVVTQHAHGEADWHGYPVLGTVESLHRVVHQQQPEVIIVSVSPDKSGLLAHLLLEAGMFRKIRIEHVTTAYEQLTGKLPIEAYEPDEFLYSNAFQPRRITLWSNRLLSLVAALVGSVLLAPLLVLIAVLIKLDSAGPVLFIQERSGLAGKRFKLLKFRTMSPSGQRTSEWEGDNTHRITRAGHWLRKFRLDELPQFFNILRGDMNIVGPRPHPVSNFELIALASRNTPESGGEIPYYYLRSSVRPGITGWAQVRYRYANNLQEEIEKLRFDLYYIKHYSVWLDIRILLETIGTVFAGSGTAEKNQMHTRAQPSSKQSSTYVRS